MTTAPEIAADLSILSTETRAALDACAPDYFDLSADDRVAQRAVWGADLPDDILNHIIDHALGKTAEEAEALKEDKSDLSPADLLKVNTWLQQVRGVGEDFFSWNECLSEGETALTFETLGDYARSNHEFQQESRSKHDDQHEPQPYEGVFNGEWARYLESGRLRYLTIDDLTSFVIMNVESAGLRVISDLVPHDHITEPSSGEPREDGLIYWNMRLDAHGKEDLYEALHKASNDQVDKIYNRLRQKSSSEASTMWIFDATDWPDYFDKDGVTAVFSGTEILDKIRTCHFRADCLKHADDVGILKDLVATEVTDFENHLRAVHAALVKSPPTA